MDEARAVLERLERIDELETAGAAKPELLVELKALLREAEAWSRTEGGEVAECAVDGLRAALTKAPVT
jgi:hypothetical protein